MQALQSYTGRVAPRLALLGAEQLERGVVQRVLRWAALGGESSGGSSSGSMEGPGPTVQPLSALLAEDAAEVRGSG